MGKFRVTSATETSTHIIISTLKKRTIKLFTFVMGIAIRNGKKLSVSYGYNMGV